MSLEKITESGSAYGYYESFMKAIHFTKDEIFNAGEFMSPYFFDNNGIINPIYCVSLASGIAAGCLAGLVREVKPKQNKHDKRPEPEKLNFVERYGPAFAATLPMTAMYEVFLNYDGDYKESAARGLLALCIGIWGSKHVAESSYSIKTQLIDWYDNRKNKKEFEKKKHEKEEKIKSAKKNKV